MSVRKSLNPELCANHNRATQQLPRARTQKNQPWTVPRLITSLRFPSEKLQKSRRPCCASTGNRTGFKYSPAGTRLSSGPAPCGSRACCPTAHPSVGPGSSPAALYMHVQKCPRYVHAGPSETEQGRKSPRAGATRACEVIQHGFRELNSASAEPSFWTHPELSPPNMYSSLHSKSKFWELPNSTK